MGRPALPRWNVRGRTGLVLVSNVNCLKLIACRRSSVGAANPNRAWDDFLGTAGCLRCACGQHTGSLNLISHVLQVDNTRFAGR